MERKRKMKKIIFLIFLLSCITGIYAQNFYEFEVFEDFEKGLTKYQVNIDAPLYNKRGEIIDIVKKGTVFSYNDFAITWGEKERQGWKKSEYYLSFNAGWISDDVISIYKSDSLPQSVITKNKWSDSNSIWIPTWYNNLIVRPKEIEHILTEKIPSYKNYDPPGFEGLGVSFDNPMNFIFKNSFCVLHAGGPVNFFYIKSVYCRDEYILLNCCFEKNPSFITLKSVGFIDFPDPSVKRDFTLKIELNGNRIKLYNGDNNKLIVELMQVTPEWVELLQKYLETGIKPAGLKPCAPIYNKPVPNDTALLSIPSSPLSVVTVNKCYRASDNLRLRSSGSTAGKPVVTIGKGTQVKVIAVGAEQTIDGITSNWVQVEVQAGAKDRDGKPIAAGTTGWCFGGYLK